MESWSFILFATKKRRRLDKVTSHISSFFRHNNWALLLACFAASIYGLVLVYSATKTENLLLETTSRAYLIQAIAIILGVFAALVVSIIDYEFIARLWPVWAVVSLVLVGLTFSPLGLQVAGADDKAWLRLGPTTIQPSEILKISFIITFSVHLNKYHDRINEILVFAGLCIHGLIPIGLIVLQGDDGTALVFALMFVSMLVAAGLRPIYFLIGATPIAALVPVIWSRLTDNKKARFLCLVYIDEYISSEGWQQYLALRAMGSGQLEGLGLMDGGRHLMFARSTDFIFTVAGEEFGFIGSIALLGILALIIILLLRNTFKAKNFLGMMMSIGILAMIGFQCIINIGMNVRLLPVIGITLPFISRGGTSIATLFLGIGLALSVNFSSRTRISDDIFTDPNY